MPSKRASVIKVSERVPVVGGSCVTAIPSPSPEKCGDIAAALRSASSLPEACRLMLVAGLEWSLAVPGSKRDSNQVAIVSFIGEVLARRKAELATCRECFEANVTCAQTLADEHAEVVRKAEEDVNRELGLANAKRAIFDEDDGQEKQACDLHSAAENARSASEANLLAVDLERDLCQAGCKLVKTGAESGEIKTVGLTESIGMIQQLATKLGLEQSLVLTLQFIAKKPMDEWSMLERAAATMIDETLAKHMVELESKLESGSATMNTHVAAVEAAQIKLGAAKGRCLASGAMLRDAEAKHQDVDTILKVARQVAKERADELRRAKDELSVPAHDLAAFCAGPMDTFLKFHGEAAAERPVAGEAASKCAPSSPADCGMAELILIAPSPLKSFTEAQPEKVEDVAQMEVEELQLETQADKMEDVAQMLEAVQSDKVEEPQLEEMEDVAKMEESAQPDKIEEPKLEKMKDFAKTEHQQEHEQVEEPQLEKIEEPQPETNEDVAQMEDGEPDKIEEPQPEKIEDVAKTEYQQDEAHVEELQPEKIEELQPEKNEEVAQMEDAEPDKIEEPQLEMMEDVAKTEHQQDDALAEELQPEKVEEVTKMEHQQEEPQVDAQAEATQPEKMEDLQPESNEDVAQMDDVAETEDVAQPEKHDEELQPEEMEDVANVEPQQEEAQAEEPHPEEIDGPQTEINEDIAQMEDVVQIEIEQPQPEKMEDPTKSEHQQEAVHVEAGEADDDHAGRTGDGVQDATEEIEDEAQLEGEKLEREQEKPNSHDRVDEGNEDIVKDVGVDSDAESQSVPEKKAKGQESLGNIDDEEKEEKDLDPKEGDVDLDNAGKLDERLWNGDEEEEQIQPEGTEPGKDQQENSEPHGAGGGEEDTAAPEDRQFNVDMQQLESKEVEEEGEGEDQGEGEANNENEGDDLNIDDGDKNLDGGDCEDGEQDLDLDERSGGGDDMDVDSEEPTAHDKDEPQEGEAPGLVDEWEAKDANDELTESKNGNEEEKLEETHECQGETLDPRADEQVFEDNATAEPSTFENQSKETAADIDDASEEEHEDSRVKRQRLSNSPLTEKREELDDHEDIRVKRQRLSNSPLTEKREELDDHEDIRVKRQRLNNSPLTEKREEHQPTVGEMLQRGLSSLLRFGKSPRQGESNGVGEDTITQEAAEANASEASPQVGEENETTDAPIPAEDEAAQSGSEADHEPTCPLLPLVEPDSQEENIAPSADMAFEDLDDADVLG